MDVVLSHLCTAELIYNTLMVESVMCERWSSMICQTTVKTDAVRFTLCTGLPVQKMNWKIGVSTNISDDITIIVIIECMGVQNLCGFLVLWLSLF